MSCTQTPVAHSVSNQIFQYDMTFYKGNLEISFIGMGGMNRSNKNSVIVGTLPFFDPPNGATYFRPCTSGYVKVKELL